MSHQPALSPFYSQRLFLISIAAIAALGGLLFGYDTGIISGALIFMRQDFKMSTSVQELIVSSVVLGALCGAICSGHLADLYGRRRLLMISSLLFILGTLSASLSPSVSIVVLGRFIIGLAIGISSYTVPLFICEMAPASQRGALVLVNAIAITAGEALAFLVDEWLIPTHSWRYMFASGLIPAMLLFLGMLIVPETPRWLILKGFLDKARNTLSKIRDSHFIDHELHEIHASINFNKTHWREIFAPLVRPVLIIGLGLGILQQFVGINTVMYYGPTIFKVAGFKTAQSQLWATFAMGCTNLVMSIIAVMIIDKIGRRPLMLGGSLVAALSLLIVGLAFHQGVHSTYLAWITLCFLFLYIAGYAISIGSLFWLIISEIYPLEIRGFAMSFVTAIQWLANFIVAFTFLSILSHLGTANTFWLYGLMCVVTFLFSYFLLPETKGISLEHIEHNLRHGVRSRDLGKTDMTVSNN